ncbi:MAG: peptide/nickel transport system permease protein [Streptosporangiaceae bacterium]|nr:Peptide transporter, permease protein [Streptosporangiaceae bacterium]MDX6433539.1 peptide/nickel transport system permease protein [Streptosporangiaceae bacterium]
MRRYIGLRLLQMIPVLVGVSTVVFLLVRLIPGDPATSMLGSRATSELVARVHQQFGLDLPIWSQYFDYLGNVVRGNFGQSFFYQTSVSSIVQARILLTLQLIGYAALLSLLIALPFATWAALRRGGIADRIIRVFFAASLGMPSFWLGIMLTLYLSVRSRIFPSTGAGVGFQDRLWHLTLPALTIAISITPLLVRSLRSSMIEVVASDFVTTGRAAGLRPGQLLLSYILRNSLLPLITVFSINVGWLIGGTVIVEQLFGLPGLGSLLITSITTRDYGIIQLVTLVFALIVLIVNLLTDLAYAALDPRVSLVS